MKTTLNTTVTKTEAQALVGQAIRTIHKLPEDTLISVTIEDAPQFTTNRAVLDRPIPEAAKFEITNGRNNKIAAIKELRAAWGLGLKEAKDYIELYCYVFLGGPKPF